MKRLTLKMKLVLLCGFFITVIVAIGGKDYLSSHKITEMYSSLVNTTLPKQYHINKSYEYFLAIRMNLRNLGLPGVPADEVERIEKKVLEDLGKIAEEKKAYEALGFTPGQKDLYDKQTKTWEDFVAVGGRVLALHKGSAEDKQKMIEIFFGDCPKTAGAFMEATKNLLEFHDQEIKLETAEAASTAASSETMTLIWIACGALLGAAMGFIFSESLSRTLRGIADSISSSAEVTRTGANQMSAASTQLSTASTEAAASLEETVASLEELTSMVKLNTNHAKEANILSQKSKESAEVGEVEISKLIASMSEMAAGSKQIEDIINVIDDIAFQTNLLALNAAVEAARAGEQGKGFAVVADAVRTLAQRSATAAKDISSLIKANVDKSLNGAKIANTSGNALKEILSSVKKVADLNTEISNGSEQQLHGLEQISRAMNALDQATQGNAASSEEVSASSEEMAQQGESLAGTVQELRDVIYGKKVEITSQRKAPLVYSKPVHKPTVNPIVSKKDSKPAIPFDEDLGNEDRKVGNVAGF